MAWLDTFQKIRDTDWSKAPDPERESKANEIVQITAYGSAAASVIPVPFVDLALLLPFHTAMVMTVGHVFGRSLNNAEAKRVALELGAVAGVTLAGRVAISAVKKLLLPGFGGVLAAPASFAVTWAFGQLAIAYFKHPNLSQDDLKKVFSDAVKEAGNQFSKETFDRFRKQAADADPPVEPADSAGSAQADEPAETPKSAEPAPKPSEPVRAQIRPKKRTM